MFVCKECGRKFKDKNALGGHVSSAHRQQMAVTSIDAGHPVEPQSPPANAQEHSEFQPQFESSQEGEEKGIMEHIRELMRDGYTAKQIQEKWGYRRQTIHDVFKQNIVPEGEPENESDETRQVLGEVPATYKQTEVLNPELMLRRYTDGSYEDELELRGMMKLRASILLAMELVNIQKAEAEADAKRVEPILKMMRESREEADAAAQRARESNIEIAERTADSTAGQLSNVFREHTTRINDSINQIRQAVGGKEEKTPMGQILTSMQEMSQLMQMFGMGMPGMPGQQAPQGGDQGWQPPPIEREKREGGGNV